MCSLGIASGTIHRGSWDIRNAHRKEAVRSLLFAGTLSCLLDWRGWWLIIRKRTSGRCKHCQNQGLCFGFHSVFCFVRKHIVPPTVVYSENSLSRVTSECKLANKAVSGCVPLTVVIFSRTSRKQVLACIDTSSWPVILLRSPNNDFIRRALSTALGTGEVEEEGFVCSNDVSDGASE